MVQCMPSYFQALVSRSRQQDILSACGSVVFQSFRFLKSSGFTYLGLLTGSDVTAAIDKLSKGVTHPIYFQFLFCSFLHIWFALVSADKFVCKVMQRKMLILWSIFPLLWMVQHFQVVIVSTTTISFVYRLYAHRLPVSPVLQLCGHICMMIMICQSMLENSWK